MENFTVIYTGHSYTDYNKHARKQVHMHNRTLFSPRWQSLIMDVFCKEMNSTSKVREWQVLPHMVHQVSKCAVCQRAQRFMCGPTLSEQHILIK